QGDLIQPARALQHPMLERPVAFLDGVSVAGLLDAVTTPISMGEILRQWSFLPFSERRKREWLHWMCRQRVLIPLETEADFDPVQMRLQPTP
ncbi:MAG: hypothetical protein JWN14_4513, partial [Chthonomonadales bacterium]|nr:hypothetical protein [Chthonomonadales bacterium]